MINKVMAAAATAAVVAERGHWRHTDIMSSGELIHRPNLLADRIGPRARVFTAELIRRAEHALAQVSAMFGSWIVDDIDRLERAIGQTGDAGRGKAVERSLKQLRGSADAFDFPIIGRLAGSLEALVGGGDQKPPPAPLVEAHLQAIRAAARDQIRSADDPIARATCEELETQTQRHLGR